MKTSTTLSRRGWLLMVLLLWGSVWLRRAGHAAPLADEPHLVSMTVTPAQVPRTGTATFDLLLEDLQGGTNILEYYLGFSDCTVAVGEALTSDFERNFARFFAAYAYRTFNASVA
ncbi:MAG TPA: hypothetical protein PK530_23990 [Anaerolineales bacterium]|nr:hypothetical protein [Anaerolineales bacterium]